MVMIANKETNTIYTLWICVCASLSGLRGCDTMMESIMQGIREYDVCIFALSPGLVSFTRQHCSNSVPANCENKSFSSRQSIFDIEVALSVFMLQNENFYVHAGK